MTGVRYRWMVAVAVPVTLFAGCASDTTPTPSSPQSPPITATKTPSSIGSSADSDAERYAAILPAYRASWVAIDELQDAGGVGAPTQAMKETLTPAYQAYWNQRAAQWRAEGRTYTGKNRVANAEIGTTSFSPTSATAQVDVCVDLSDVQAYSKDGKPLSRTTKPFMSGTVGMTWSDGHWRVVGFINGTGGYVDRC